MNQRRVLNKLLGNLRTMMEKCANKKYLTECVNVIYAWTRDGDDADKKKKLEIIRNLGGDLKTDLEHHTAYRHAHTIYPHHIPTSYTHTMQDRRIARPRGAGKVPQRGQQEGIFPLWETGVGVKPPIPRGAVDQVRTHPHGHIPVH